MIKLTNRSGWTETEDAGLAWVIILMNGAVNKLIFTDCSRHFTQKDCVAEAGIALLKWSCFTRLTNELTGAVTMDL